MVVGLTYSAPFRFPGASLAGLDMAQRDPYRILPPYFSDVEHIQIWLH